MENKKNHHGRKPGRKPGRPPHNPDYDPEELMRELLDMAVEVYNVTHEIKATAVELDLPANKVKKLLITAEVISYPEAREIQQLFKI